MCLLLYTLCRTLRNVVRRLLSSENGRVRPSVVRRLFVVRVQGIILIRLLLPCRCSVSRRQRYLLQVSCVCVTLCLVTSEGKRTD